MIVIKLVFTRVCEIVCYSFGFLFGVIADRFGFSGVIMRAIDKRNNKKEMEEAIRIMNDQGPNN